VTTADPSPLAALLTHDGWHAAKPADRVVPRAPMVLHRGGWPDGA
jgi:hypothetical protein